MMGEVMHCVVLVLRFCVGAILAIAMPRMSCCFEADSIISLWYTKVTRQTG